MRMLWKVMLNLMLRTTKERLNLMLRTRKPTLNPTTSWNRRHMQLL